MIIAKTTRMMITDDMIFLVFLLNLIRIPLFCNDYSRQLLNNKPYKELYMNLLLFASTFTLALAIMMASSKSRKNKDAIEREFWERERAANNTRRKSLDDLPYIKLPMDIFPTELLPDNPRIEEYRQTILSLNDLPIVNFTGYTNTDLKLRYGAPNINLLTSYDQSYTLLVRTLQQWAQALYDGGYPREACQLLEFSVSTGTDVSATYRLLCKIYLEQGTPEKIADLYPVAENLNSASQKNIIGILQEAAGSSV